MVYILGMTQTLVQFGLVGQEVLIDGARQLVKRNGNILCISELFELNMGHALVSNVCWIVGWHIAGQFGEVGSHNGDLIERCKCFCNEKSWELIFNNDFNSSRIITRRNIQI